MSRLKLLRVKIPRLRVMINGWGIQVLVGIRVLVGIKVLVGMRRRWRLRVRVWSLT